MYCKYCGTANNSESKFCANCGASLVEEQTQNTYKQPSYEQPNYSQPNAEQNPYANYNPSYQNNSENGKGFAIAGMVCGIISLFCFPYILGALGIVFGAVAKSKGYKGGMAIAGIICGILGIILGIITQAFLFA